MNRLIFTHEPPLRWNDLCTQHCDLFNTVKWQEMLYRGFGSTTMYGWNEALSTGVTITIFKAGPFRIGYLGFPAGGMVGSRAISPDIVLGFKDAPFPYRLHCIRIPVSPFAEGLDLPIPAQTTQETSIENLQDWSPEINAKLYRDIKKAENAPLTIVDAEPCQGESIYELYRETVCRHHGSLRYTVEYFRELIILANTEPNLRCLLAMNDDRIAGFLVAGCHHSAAYYLHSGTNHEFKHYVPSDLLLFEAIKWAREAGMEEFNMMGSPSKQPSLVRYKEKWGGTTREQKTYELALRPFQVMIFRTAAGLYHRLSRCP